MTAHAHRAPFRPFDLRARRARGVGSYPPEALLALSALLVLLAGPVARAVAPPSAWVAGASALLLAAGVVLAVLATRHLLRRTEG